MACKERHKQALNMPFIFKRIVVSLETAPPFSVSSAKDESAISYILDRGNRGEVVVEGKASLQ